MADEPKPEEGGFFSGIDWKDVVKVGAGVAAGALGLKVASDAGYLGQAGAAPSGSSSQRPKAAKTAKSGRAKGPSEYNRFVSATLPKYRSMGYDSKAAMQAVAEEWRRR